ncbi:hypothetical protein EHS25_006266 [Saitozyma podzolica]|uniref:Uncharacterized protein n=1 Tax=Saitozyma podzolica TaxID=1890683 RepID=A0A427YRC1_9TREE|nr:hypothetical protein EHS25_006266 [Saitozyma podzolica]
MIVSLIRLSAVLAVLGHVTAVPTRAADPRSFQNGDSDVQCYFTCPSLDGYTLDTSTATNSYYAGYQVSAQVCQYDLTSDPTNQDEVIRCRYNTATGEVFIKDYRNDLCPDNAPVAGCGDTYENSNIYFKRSIRGRRGIPLTAAQKRIRQLQWKPRRRQPKLPKLSRRQ